MQLNRYHINLGLACFSMLAAALVSHAATSRNNARAHYAYIESRLSRFHRVRRSLPGVSAEGGSVVSYFDGPTLSKMVVTYYGETGKKVEDYYFWQGQLFFVLRAETRYKAPLGSKEAEPIPGTVASKAESRFYFRNGELTRWIGAHGKSMDVRSADAQQQAREVLADARHLSAVSRSR